MPRLLLFLLLVSAGLSAQDFLRTQGSQIVDGSGQPYFLHGIGLGGWMVQEGYMMKTSGFAGAQHMLRERITDLIGSEATQEFYDAWLANHVREADIQRMHEAGFNSVRLPMHYNLYTLPVEEEPVAGRQTFLDTGIALTDSLIAWCKARDMYVVLDLHAAPGGQGDDVNISDRDVNKPSLWESQANRDKTVALWKHLATRYADEPTVAGYDLINETNYVLGEDNAPLGALMREITDSIRSVDQRHIIFVEGNGFANNFTGLTPPWDDNMVYSPHKYWNYNTEEALGFALALRDTTNTPLYLGETGENSNVWFRNAVMLFDEVDMGWAWWPWKKIESITGPVSVTLNPGYQKLLDYWSGEGPRPSAEDATAALMQLTEDLKLENARYQRDVTDAMFRQTRTTETLPWIEHRLPGTVYAEDFDLGPLRYAYMDRDTGNYWVSTGERSRWNSGGAYRNDAVDIGLSDDTELTQGYYVGWTEPGEWLQYTVDVAEAGTYDATLRVASDTTGGRFRFALDEAQLRFIVDVPNTGGDQEWITLTVRGLRLPAGEQRLRLYVDGGGFNVGGMRFARAQ
ncbi:cellulase family glycosylhydrolase [Lewinella sp. IMCC34183]|uniref:cellulase family glycosylhydrolase n=1 Tax=Lewinella sp. IMCC34183 TaxID=2248762 RepID=UPI0018E51340|nr:cellulase family glycosylhydrolase [Lewinella sp. IMCC34183]